MEAVPSQVAPRLLPGSGPPPVPGEAAELASLASTGVALAPFAWVPAAAEEAFYGWNRLPARLNELFAPVAERDPDEDDVEDLAAVARSLIAQHALLDAWVDAFYEALGPLPDDVRVRRPGAPGRRAARGRPALLALRAAWADDWSADAVLARLRASGSVELEAAPLLLHGADDLPAGADLAGRVREVLGVERAVRVDPEGRVTRLGSAARP